ncbi:hypothetical protein [Microbacterium sp.]|uniref:hypothetical protein n=1 Tax=Microbacterium sp. TaxID=51671 RepID=UPI0039E54E59
MAGRRAGPSLLQRHVRHAGAATGLGLLTATSLAVNVVAPYVLTAATALARRWPDVLAHAVDPGWVPTRMGGRSAPDSLDEGRRTQEWLAAADAEAITPRTGGYWCHLAARRFRYPADFARWRRNKS